MKFKVTDHETDAEDEVQEVEARNHRHAAIQYAKSVYETEGSDVTVDCDVEDEAGKKLSFSVEIRLEINVISL